MKRSLALLLLVATLAACGSATPLPELPPRSALILALAPATE